jgi:hypothetical protein
MAIHIFLILSGLSIVFLVYVLAQLWLEGHRPQGGAEPVMVHSCQWNPNVIVVTHPISFNARGGISATPLQPQALDPEIDRGQIANKARVLEMRLKRRTGEPRPSSHDSKIKVC